MELEIDLCSSVQKSKGYLLSYAVTEADASSSNPLCLSDRKNGNGDQVRFINHQICNEDSIDLEAEVEKADFQTQWIVKEGETEKSLAQWQWSFHFTLSPFPDGPQESQLSG